MTTVLVPQIIGRIIHINWYVHSNFNGLAANTVIAAINLLPNRPPLLYSASTSDIALYARRDNGVAPTPAITILPDIISAIGWLPRTTNVVLN
jgi:hypothetical protein